MNSIIHKDVRKLEADAEAIEQGLNSLTKDCLAWVINRAEQDLTGLMEDLKEVEVDVSLMLTDCISTRLQHGEDASKEVFRDFCKIFGCVDTFFKDLKEARLQLGEAYIRPSTLNHLEVDCKRFEKFLEKVQGYAVCL